MRLVKQCIQCGKALPRESLGGLCPVCALEGALELPEDSISVSGGSEFNLDRALPAHFGEYDLLEEIAQGGMGIVYKAWQRSLDRIVAIKMMRAEHLARPSQVRRFRQEAAAAARLQHPNIVAVYEAGEIDGQHFYSMDFVAGRSLGDLVGEHPLPPRRAAAYVKSIAQAIHYAHERGVLHRDLKPSNILIDQNDQPRVVDFGLAKRLESDSHVTLTGQVLGSPSYVPPEQARGKRGNISRQSDVYSLGAILFHAVTGRPPFVAEGLAATLEQVLHTEPVSPRLLNPSVPADLETICLKCLDKEPSRRYATAQDMAAELARFQAGEPILARPVGLAGKVWRWHRRNPRLAYALGVAAVSLLLGLAGVTSQWCRAQREALLARRHAYALAMSSAHQALESHDLGRAVELLNEHQPHGRGRPELDSSDWEWRYLKEYCRGEEKFTLCQYRHFPAALSLSADERFLAVHLLNRGILVWDLASRKEIGDLHVGIRHMKPIAFSPVGNLLATGDEDSERRAFIGLWQIPEMKQVARLPDLKEVISLAFSPDGQTLAAFGADQKVRVWRVPERQLSATLPVSMPAVTFVGVLRFSPDCNRLAVGETDGNVRIWDWKTATVKSELPAPVPGEGVSALAFSPNGSTLAAGYAPGLGTSFKGSEQFGVIHLWNWQSGEERLPLKGHAAGISALEITADGHHLVSASLDQTLKLWDLAMGRELRTFQGHTREVWGLALMRDSKTAVSSSKDGSIRFWDIQKTALETGAGPTALPIRLPTLGGLAFAPDMRTLAMADSDGSVSVWNAMTMQKIETLAALGTNNMSVAFSAGGQLLLAGDSAGFVKLLEWRQHRPVANVRVGSSPVLYVILEESGDLVSSISGETLKRLCEINLWKASSWRKIRQLNLRNIDCQVSSSDFRWVAVADQNGTITAWNLITGEKKGEWIAHLDGIKQLAYSKNGRLLASASIDGTLKIWDLSGFRQGPPLRGYSQAAFGAAFSPDGSRLATSGTSMGKSTISLIDTITWQETICFEVQGAWFYELAFSPDGQILVARADNGTYFWRAPSWTEIESNQKQKAGLETVH